MAKKTPRLCASVTFTSAPTVRLTSTGLGGFDVSLAAGRYWADPVYSGSLSASIGLWNALASAIDTADAVHTYTLAFGSSDVSTNDPRNQFGWVVDFFPNAGATVFDVTHANNNTEGKRLLDAIGIDRVNTHASLEFSGPYPAWSPGRGDSVDVDEAQKGYSVSVETENGTVYTSDLGSPLRRRVITLNGLEAYKTRARVAFGRISDEDVGDGSFEAVMWPLLASGELFRYWADENATLNTYTTAAMTSTSGSVTLASVTGLTDLASFPPAMSICVDGEWMIVDTIVGTTVTVRRSRPVAHPAYAPVSTAFVGTYALAPSGGNINLGEFAPVRRGPEDDRWDLAISCVRAAW